MSDKIPVDPDLLTPADLQRAKAILGPAVFEGRDPIAVINDPLDGLILAIWCQRSRHDREFTWDDAANTPFGELDYGEGDQPPPTAPNAADGGRRDSGGPNANKPKRRASEPRESSATGSGSAEPNTTG